MVEYSDLYPEAVNSSLSNHAGYCHLYSPILSGVFWVRRRAPKSDAIRRHTGRHGGDQDALTCHFSLLFDYCRHVELDIQSGEHCHRVTADLQQDGQRRHTLRRPGKKNKSRAQKDGQRGPTVCLQSWPQKPRSPFPSS
jgi:hypothetical protein